MSGKKSRQYKGTTIGQGCAFYELLEELEKAKSPKDRKELQTKVDKEWKRLDDEFHSRFPREDWDRIVQSLRR